MAETRLGAYELLERLGEGGMAEVWRARVIGAAGFSRGVALKLMRPSLAEDPELVQLFIDEARLSAQLRHPNIVATLDFGFEAGRYFIAMELVDGVPLRTIQRHHPIFTLPLALHVCGAVATALEYSFGAPGEDGRPLELIHRDINPANLLVSTHGEVKLADFGIAKASSRVAQTQAGSLRGKIRYMSPEQAWGRPLDGRSDLFALGLTLYELVAGTFAFAGDEELAVLERARNADFGPLSPRVPIELRPILDRALALDREARFPTATAMRQALRDLRARFPPEDHAAELAKLVEAVRVPFSTPARAKPATDLAHTRGHTELATVPGGAETPGYGTANPESAESRASTVPEQAPSRRPPSLLVGALLTALAAVTTGTYLWARASRVPVSITTPAPVVVAIPDLARVEAMPDAALAFEPSIITPPVSGKSGRAHPAGQATLRIQVEPWADVSVDGKKIGMTPLAPLAVSSGPHTVEAVNPNLPKKRVTIQLGAGESKLVHIVLGGKP